MPATRLFIATALVELAAGVCSVISPSLSIELVLGVGPADPTSLVVTRLLGTSLLAIGVVCWSARNNNDRPAGAGLVVGLLIYNMGAVVLLTCAAHGRNMAGVALWPAVALHAALAIWCALRLTRRLRVTR
jgi:hypothetical protein